MKKSAGILLFYLLVSITLNGQPVNNAFFKTPVTIEAEEKPLADILNEITKKAGVYFSYDASAVVSDRPVTLHVTNTPVITVLNSLFDTTLFAFTEKENQIIISLNEDTQKSERVWNDSLNNPEIITLTGKLTDEKYGFPLSYATISIFDKPIGTITNSEGEFILKISRDNEEEPILLSHLGYSQKLLTVKELMQYKNSSIAMHPVSILIKEVKVHAITPYQLLDSVIDRIGENYGNRFMMMKGFYRETLKQDDKYINISEAVVDILKAPYLSDSRDDKVRIVKGRKSPDVTPFQWVNFKLMGGPTTMTKLDILKTMDDFINPDSRSLYRYNIDRVIWFQGHPCFVLQFKPIKAVTSPCYLGEIFIDRETYAILHIDFGYSKQGLKVAEESLIRKKPRGYKVKPADVHYNIDYRYAGGQCYLYATKASMMFKVRNHRENINSQFNIVSELLVTDLKKSQIKRFPKDEVFNMSDILSDNIKSFDKNFWGNFNILKPDEELESAIESLKFINRTEDNPLKYKNGYLTKSEFKK